MLGCPLRGLTHHPEHGASGVLLLRLLPILPATGWVRHLLSPAKAACCLLRGEGGPGLW
jgi:hypothetical protein